MGLEETQKRAKRKGTDSWSRVNTGYRSVSAPWTLWARWEAAAANDGLTMNGWVRKVLTERCDLEEAIIRMETIEREAGLLVDRSAPHDQEE